LLYTPWCNILGDKLVKISKISTGNTDPYLQVLYHALLAKHSSGVKVNICLWWKWGAASSNV